MGMQNVSSLASTQTDFDTFLPFLKKILGKHVHAKFQLSSIYPDGLRKIFDHFLKTISRFFRKTLERIPKKIKSE
jgi:hypothetical protein